MFYTVMPVLLAYGAFVFAQRVRNWERGGARQPRAPRRRTPSGAWRDFRAGVYMKTLLRDPAAGVMHSMIYFGFLRAARRHDRARDRPPAAREPEVPARQHLPWPTPWWATRPAWSSWAASCGRSCGATCSGRTASASSRSPSTRSSSACSASSACRASPPRCSASPRTARPAFEKWSFVGYPLATLVDGLSQNTLDVWHQVSWVGCTWWPSWPSWSSCPSRCCGTCSPAR